MLERFSAGSYRGRRCSSSGHSGAWKFWLSMLFFPAVIFYLELVLHIRFKMELAYLPVYLVFSLAAGAVLTALVTPFSRKVNSIVARVVTVLLCLLYTVEIVCKEILQSFYPFSTLGVAAGNRLGDYSEVIVTKVVALIPLILVLFLPAIFLIASGSRIIRFPRCDWQLSVAVLVAAAVLHVGGLGLIHLPWSGDLTPSKLYQVDTNIDDQVEQLGLWTMLRLDLKHQIIPPQQKLDHDFAGLGGLDGQGSSGSTSTPDPGSSSGETPVVEPVDTSPNVMDVDLAALAAETSNDDVAWLAEYFNSVTPTKKNEYTGMFEGYNVIQLVIEGFSGYVIDPELTPTLYKLSTEGFVFNNYYTALHYTSTSNGECQTLLGLYPKNGNPITMKRTGELGTNCYFSLAAQLGRAGYDVYGYHGNYEMYGRQASHSNLGYNWRQYKSGLELEMNSSGSELLWPQRDKYVVESSVGDYINSDKPFHVYYLTISGHMPYSNNRVAKQYRDIVDQLPYSDTTRNYIATAIEVDRALETLLDELEAAGKLDKTLIVATGDHIPYFDVATLEELAGKTFGNSKDLEALKESNIDFDVYKNTLIMWSASMEEPVEVDKVCCQVDILPTVSNLLGLEYDSRMLSGSDILSDSEGLVIFTSRCWKSDRGFYDRYTQTFTPAPGVTMTQEEQDHYVSTMKKLVEYKLSATELIVENDFYDIVFGDKFTQDPG